MNRSPGAQPPPSPPQGYVGDQNGPPGGWGRLIAIGAVGALLLALFVAPSGSTVAVAGAVAVAGVLGTIATILFLRGRMTGGAPGGPPMADAPHRSGPSTAPPIGEGGLAGSAASGPSGPLSPPADAPRPGGTGRAAAAAAPLEGGNTTQWHPPAPAAGPDRGVPENVSSVCRQIAQSGVDRLLAPASSVLIRHGRRLVAGGTAGDWALARRLQAQTPGEAPVRMGGSHVNARAGDDGEPPQFPMDDALPRLLAVYTQAIPIERWHELEDAPAEVLPLAGLADGGAGVCVPLGHSRELAGLWVLARRPGQRPYSDAELRTLENAARQAAPALAAALAAHPG